MGLKSIERGSIMIFFSKIRKKETFAISLAPFAPFTTKSYTQIRGHLRGPKNCDFRGITVNIIQSNTLKPKFKKKKIIPSKGFLVIHSTHNTNGSFVMLLQTKNLKT